MTLDVGTCCDAASRLLGREPEVSALHAFIATAREAGGALVLTGDPGLGKSALVDMAVTHARATGVRVTTMSGTEVNASQPFSALAGLAPVLSEPGLLSADQEDVLAGAFSRRSGTPRLLVSTAVLSAVRRASVAVPLLITVEDAQWLDDPSAEVLAFVARRLHGSQAGLLAASRRGNGPLSGHGRLPVRQLTRLTDDAARDLLKSRYPDLSSGVRERLVTEAEGIPLALVELPLALVGEQRTSREALPAVLPMTGRLRVMFDSRISALPQETRLLLLVLALADGADPRLPRSATGLDTRETLRPAQSAGLVALHPVDGRAAFTQPLARSAVVAAATGAELRQARRLLADAMTDQVERRVWHLAAAAEGSLNVRTFDALLAFNDGDLATAYRTVTGALRLFGSAADDRSLGHALDVLQSVCQTAGSDEMWSGFGQAVVALGHRAPASSRLLSEIGVPRAKPSRTLLAELDAAVDQLASEDDNRIIVQVATAAVAVDRGIGCQPALRRVLRDGGTVASGAVASYLLAEIGLATGNISEVRNVVADGLARCDSAGHVPYAMLLRSVLALSAAATGDRAALATLTEQVLSWAKEARAYPVLRTAHWALGRAALSRSDHAVAYCHLLAMAGEGGMESVACRQPGALFDLAEAAAGSGHADLARAYIARARTGTSNRWDMIALGARALVDDRDPVAAFERAVALRGADRWPFDLARIRLAYGEQLRRTGALDAAREQLNSALDAFRALDASPWIARTASQLRTAGETVVGIGPRREPLTSREEQVAALAAAGLTNRDIAARMHLSARTIAAHLHQVFRKTGVTSRAQLPDALACQRQELRQA